MLKNYWHKGEQPVKGLGFLLIRNPGGGIDWIVPDRDIDYSQLEWMYFNELCNLIKAHEEGQGQITELKAALVKSRDALEYLCKRAFEGGCLVNAGYRGHVGPKSTEYCNERCGVNNAIIVANKALEVK